LQCAHPHYWTSMDWNMILKLLLKHDNSYSNIFLLQDPNKHLSFMALILWTTMDQTFIFISSLGVNRLFYVVDNSYPTTKSPQNINLVQSQRLDKNSGQSQPVQTSLLPNIPSVPKTYGALTKQQALFLGQNTFHTQFEIPKNITHELPHNHSINLRYVHPLSCAGPYVNTCNNSRPFLDILSTTEVFSSGFFWSSPLDQIQLLPIYNNFKIKIWPHFFVLSKTKPLTFFLSLPSTYLHFLSLLQTSSSSFHLFMSPKSRCQSLPKI